MTKAMQRKPLKDKKSKFKPGTIVFYLMMLPMLVYIIINNILPMYGITIAFRDISFAKGPLNSPFYGFGELKDYSIFHNFEILFKSDIIGTLIRNTVLYNIVFMALGIVIPVAAAILFTTIASKRAQKTFQTIVLLPMVISWVIVSYITNAFLDETNGLFTHLFGITDFYHNTKYWPFILTFFNVWKGFGMSMVVYVSALVGIDPSLYEAASMDGATWWHRTVHITLPLLKKMIITMFILNLSKIMASDFGLFYQLSMNVGALYDVTQTLDVYVFNTLMGDSINIALSSAVSVFQSIVGFVLIISSNLAIRKIDKDSAMF